VKLSTVVTVIVAVRDAPVLDAAVTLTFVEPDPLAGETVAHVWLLATVQVTPVGTPDIENVFAIILYNLLICKLAY
jgi:hypothetical protein